MTEILVVRLGAMGDVIHALPAVASLRQSYPGSRVTWVVEPRWTPLLAGNQTIDEVVTFDRRSLASALATLRRLRARRFDLAVDFQGLLKSALLAFASDVERIAGFDSSAVRERPAALFYTATMRPHSAHVVDRNLELAHHAGATAIVRAFPLPPGREEGRLPSGDFVLANPLAGWASKQWPLESYSEVASRLELPLVVNDARELAVPGTWPHASGLDGLIHATRRAAAVIGVDSGPMHLAAALGKPGVALFGPTDPARNGPYGGSLTVLRSPAARTSYKRQPTIDPSMREISPAQVIAALTSKLARAARG